MERTLHKLVLLLALNALVVCDSVAEQAPSATERASFDSHRAMGHIHSIMRWAPRSIGTLGHARTLSYIAAHLRSEPDMVIVRQEWTEQRDDGGLLRLTNLIARLHPESAQRLILSTHYDSIVRAYRDPNPALRISPMPGANNSASGVALLLEVARVLSRIGKIPLGVDFVFFDGEEGPNALGAGDPNWRALGSPYFARHVRDLYPSQLPRAAVAYDMVCKTNLRLYPEHWSVQSAPDQVRRFWSIGASLAPEAFQANPETAPIGDDQVPLAKIGIPSLLVIDFDYEPWFNTSHDTEDKCSERSLAAVGRTTVAFVTSFPSSP
jgi:hypothetical protein